MFYATYYENFQPRFWTGSYWSNNKADAKHFATIRDTSESIRKTWKGGVKPKNHSAAYNILRVDDKPLTDADRATA
jgi:hypothetical protein